MTLSQKIFTSATKAALDIDLEASEHAVQSLRLSAFNDGGFAPADFPFFEDQFNRSRSNLRILGNAGQLTASERDAKAEAAKTAATGK